MTNISNSRSSFFPNTKTTNSKYSKIDKAALNRNSYDKQTQIDNNTKRDAKVEIPEAIKDFSKIKKVVDATPEIDNTAKIAALKEQIKNGTYKMDYDAVANKILTEEFGNGI